MRLAKTHISTCLLTLVVMIAIGGCSGHVSQSAELDIEETQSKIISIHFVEDYDEYFMPGADFSATRADVKDYAKFITIVLFDENGTKKYEMQQSSWQAYFGTINKRIDFGIYRAVVIANNGDDYCDVNSPTSVTLPKVEGAKVSDTFYYIGEIEVSGTSSNNISIQLMRAVSAIGVQMTDKSVPDNFDHFRFELTGGSNEFNPTTGYGASAVSQVADVEYNSQAKQHGIFTFPLKGNDEGVTFKASAIAKDGSTIISYSFDHLTAAPKNMIIYKGDFFPKTDATISIPDSETTWTTSEQSLHQ